MLNLRATLQETEQLNQAVLSSLQDHIALLRKDMMGEQQAIIRLPSSRSRRLRTLSR